jgi:hypothetical protein
MALLPFAGVWYSAEIREKNFVQVQDGVDDSNLYDQRSSTVYLENH